jgi:hypothetical protein
MRPQLRQLFTAHCRRVFEAAEMVRLVHVGCQWRASGSTSANRTSSRSHAIFNVRAVPPRSLSVGTRSPS